MKVAFQGEMGAFSECAAMLLVDGAEPVPTTRADLIFDQLSKGVVDHAVIAIENASSGSSFDYYDLLLDHAGSARQVRIGIEKEMTLNIRHNLVCHPEAQLSDLKSVCSHPNALAQCRSYLKRNRLRGLEYDDTARFLARIREDSILDTAAIASVQAARDQGMKIVDRDIQDRRDLNYTRFLLLSRRPFQEFAPAALRRVSAVFCLQNRPGALFKAMSIFGSRDIDIIRIETRPLLSSRIPKWERLRRKTSPWDLMYQIDFAGTPAQCKRALDHLEELVISDGLCVLGAVAVEGKDEQYRCLGIPAQDRLDKVTGELWRAPHRHQMSAG